MKKWSKRLAITAGVIVGLALLILAAISLTLTPERLTRWIREYGSEYLNGGRVDVGRVDLTIWSKFPHAILEIDSLAIVNNNIPDSVSTVLSVEHLDGRLNLAALLIGRISVSRAEIIRPQATLWFGADSTQNSLNILPPSEPSEPSTEPLSLPDIRINSFTLEGDADLRYISVADSLNAGVTLQLITLEGKDSTPQYMLTTRANVNAPSVITYRLPVELNGGIGWKPSEPLAVSLHDFTVALDSINTRTSLVADFSNGVRMESLNFELLHMPVQRLAEIADSIPALAGKVPAISTDGTVDLTAKLLKPYTYDPDTLLYPDMDVDVKLNDSPLKIPSYYLALTNLGAELNARISSAGLDATTVDLKRLSVQFPASDFSLTGTATNLASDPAISGCFKGKVNFSNLDRRLWPLIGMRLGGKMDADVDIKTRLSYLTPNAFHHICLTGEASLSDFTALLPADTIAAGLTRANIRFGSSDSFHGVDSLLMASIKVDSLWVEMPDLNARAGDVKLGAGVSNTSTTLDSTTVTPMGGYLAINSLTYSSNTDSTRARIRSLAGGVTLSRYNGNNRMPKLSAKLKAKRMVYADGINRASLRGLDISASAHPSKKKNSAKSPRTPGRSRRDSIALVSNKFETLDLGIDRSAVTMLRRLNVSGSLKAEGGRIMTPLFPLRTRLSDLNMTFSADSIMLNSLKIKAGFSDLALSGSITNIQRSMGRKSANSPIRLALNLASDTINVNQLTRAAFRGAAFAAKADSLKTGSANLDADDDALQADADAEASGETMAIVVPMNIDAKVNLNARNIIYSNLDLKDLRGEILVANGAASLSDLHASTDIGSVDLNMLYYAPTRQDVNFGVGLDMHRFNIGRITELMPTLDSIMPILNTLGGIIDVGISATTPVDSAMNIKLPELNAMVRLTGDSLRVLDDKTFKTVSKWLLFHDKNKNMIDHMDVQLTVDNNQLSLYPFMFDFDRYRIGVMGNNDLALNLNYHVSILKSPIPFKFGINIKGNADKMKIRLGRARFKENMAAESRQLSDTVRINLANEIKNVFARGAKSARLGPLKTRRPLNVDSIPEVADTLSAADSLYFRQNGLSL
ncbi:MAG: AsmA family protein [Bacteroides sp.]|nr:AsmA family protein [Bacteroides sp.]MCM1378977.1 AsmA family protein [Bacteroides sp.]MCM1445593.1 AsmA family protein [Prevotella sp.]